MSTLDYRSRWLEACRHLADTTRKLETEWQRVTGDQRPDECWAEAESARAYLGEYQAELEAVQFHQAMRAWRKAEDDH